jgi:creatinine amidohydrolase
MTPFDRFRWAAYSSAALAAYPRGEAIAVLPVGAIEQHGPHLPVATDTAIVDGLVEATIKRLGTTTLNVLFLPTIPIGKSDEHLRYPGTLTFSAETLVRVWTEIGASVARAGVRKILMLNSHGGQMGPLEIAARQLRIECQMLAVGCNWFMLGLPDGLFSADEQRIGIHAGDMETSMMLALMPDRVAMDQARNFGSTSEDNRQLFRVIGHQPGARIGWQMQDLNPAGAAGDATKATAAKGQAVINHVADRLVDLLKDMAEYDLKRLDVNPEW